MIKSTQIYVKHFIIAKIIAAESWRLVIVRIYSTLKLRFQYLKDERSYNSKVRSSWITRATQKKVRHMSFNIL